MATSLVQGLRRAYQIARFAQRRSLASATALEIWELRISRRRLLQGSLSAAGVLSALALERKVDATTAPVLIVGAGIAGLTAAYYLNRSGVPVRIIEPGRPFFAGHLRAAWRGARASPAARATRCRHSLVTVVGLAGFEPATPALSRRCSNQLSYRPTRSLPCPAVPPPRP